MEYTQVNIGEGWTKAHGFFVIMGGFHAFQRDDLEKPDGSLNPGTPLYPLDDMMVRVAVRKGLIELPLKEEIQDKSKTDWLAKILVLFQTGWFVVQCIARGVAHLPLSELEVITLAYTIMNVGICIAWWDKPRNVEPPIRVFMSSDMVEDEREDEVQEKSSIIDKNEILNPIYSLIPGVAEQYDHLSRHSSVPIFYSGVPNHGRDFLPSGVVASAVGTLFGATHFISLSYPFPSQTEQLLWRLSSIALIGVPACVLVGSWSATLINRALKHRDESSLMLVWVKIILWFMLIFWAAGFVLVPLFYVAARVTTFVLAFKSMASLPPTAFQTIPWTKWIPHI
jgi:hypothetical protein